MSAPVDSTASRTPAHTIWVEMTTRIVTRSLHFRSGQEETALKSIVDLFKTTRTLMTQYPDASEFLDLAGRMLESIRPYTARWHSMVNAGERFLNPALRRQFRAELQSLQKGLQRFVEQFASLSGHGPADAPASTPHTPNMGKSFDLGIERPFQPPPSSSAVHAEHGSTAIGIHEINDKEREHIARRRGMDVRATPAAVSNGIGLALSGGGIRSATFCLGVVEVLAEKHLLRQFDYLSTVSGGGYLGCFMSNQFPSPASATAVAVAVATAKPDEAQQSAAGIEAAKVAWEKIFEGTSSDTTPVRHLRNNSKYLLPVTALSGMVLGGLLASGMLTTILLAIAIPVCGAMLTHLAARFGILHCAIYVGLCAAGPALLWYLVRPITVIWRACGAKLDVVAALCLLLSAVLLAVAATPAALDLVSHWPHWKLGSSGLAGIAAVVSGGTALKAVGYLWPYRRLISRIFILSGVVLYLIVYLAVFQYLGTETSKGSMTTPEIWVCGALGLWVLWAAVVNINLTGLHRYYRDKLASCYLTTPESRNAPADPPIIDLGSLSGDLPYHLINTTVNLPASRNSELRGRDGDFFLLSKWFCGSPIVGFQPTSLVYEMNRDLDLATAMAVSGAAASTNMGQRTMHQYRLLMAIFNIRLGYWLRWNRQPFGQFSSNAFSELTREMLGWLDEKSSTLNLSDGGHIENLAAYELIRRKLKFIVCIDGGMDGGMTCADLNRLQRLVAIDFGYRIDFDTTDLQLADGFSTNYGLLAKIDYTPDVPELKNKELGWMLYIKLALLGTETNYVLDYHRQNPLFPHQSTLNQFFDEAQFEAYRKLGASAANNFLAEEFGTKNPASVEEWMTELAGYLLRDNDEVFSSLSG
jgi:hypothetical protein